MQRSVAALAGNIRELRHLPEFQLLVPGFSLSLLWEFLQSPFYTDTFEVSWVTLAYNRLHCSGGDAVILLLAFWLVALRWGRFWMRAARGMPVVLFLALSVTYTAFSEHYNVHLMQTWAYSRWMPTIAGMGLVPLLQWVVVPMLCVHRIRSHSPAHRREVADEVNRGTDTPADEEERRPTL